MLAAEREQMRREIHAELLKDLPARVEEELRRRLEIRRQLENGQ
jgi:hypothetical protein